MRCRLVGPGILTVETSLNRRNIIIAPAVIVLVATIPMTYFGSLEDTVSPTSQNPTPASATPAQQTQKPA